MSAWLSPLLSFNGSDILPNNVTKAQIPVIDPGSGTTYAFSVSLAIDIALGTVIILAYAILQSLPQYQWCFYARLHINRPRDDPKFTLLNFDRPSLELKSKSWIQFAFEVWRMSDEQLMKMIGLDAVMLLRFFKLGIKVFAILGSFGLLIMMPIYSLGQGQATQMNRYTMGNLPFGSSPAISLCCVAVLVFSVLISLFTFKEYESYIKLRHKFYLTRYSPASRSVVVMDLPEEFQNDITFGEQFKRMFNDVIFHFVFRDTKRYEELIRQKNHLKNELERREIRGDAPNGLFNSCCSTHSTEEIMQNLRRIDRHLEDLVHTDPRPSSTAVASFKSLSSKFSALNHRISMQSENLCLIDAPEPYDIYWRNISLSHTQRLLRESLTKLAVFLLIAFYVIPVSLVASLVTVTQLSEVFPFLSTTLQYSPTASGFVTGFLSTLAYKIFMILLPYILSYLSTLQGHVSYSAIQISVFEKYFLFQFFNFFLASIFTNSFFKVLSRILSSPQDVTDLLASSLPGFSSFFINYIMLETFILIPLQLSQFWRLVFAGCHSESLKTEKDLWNLRNPRSIDYGSTAPVYLLVLVVGLTYSIIAPLILPFVFLFFLCNWVVCAHQFLFVFFPDFDTGGQSVARMLRKVYMALIVFQLTMSGYFALKGANLHSSFVALLFFLTIYGGWRSLKKFDDLENSLSLDECLAEDEKDEKERSLLSINDDDEDERSIINDPERWYSQKGWKRSNTFS